MTLCSFTIDLSSYASFLLSSDPCVLFMWAASSYLSSLNRRVLHLNLFPPNPSLLRSLPKISVLFIWIMSHFLVLQFCNPNASEMILDRKQGLDAHQVILVDVNLAECDNQNLFHSVILSFSLPVSTIRCSVPGVREAGGAIQHGARSWLYIRQSVGGHHAHAGKQCQHLHQGKGHYHGLYCLRLKNIRVYLQYLWKTWGKSLLCVKAVFLLIFFTQASKVSMGAAV